MIDPIPLLSSDDARAVVATLDGLRSQWVFRDATGRFATLGRAAYLDLCAGRGTLDSYQAQAAQQNSVLAEHCGPVLEKVRACIEREVRLRTVLTSTWALPGFHVFVGPGLRGASAGGAHFDLQFRALIGDRPLERVRPLSFTLALELPPAGSGLRVWPVRPHQVDAATTQHRADTIMEYLARKPSIYVRYEVGMLYVHREALLHCIANTDPIGPSDRRITLQGHGIVDGGQVILYW